MKRKMFALPLLCATLTSVAQTQQITFEQDDQYRSLSVYDSWEESPFNTNELQGNVAVIDNFLTASDPILGKAPNASAKMLAFQRSRFASNMYGARVDLKEPIALSPTEQYVHAFIHKPTEGRVMLIGLGKRTDRAGQGEIEQFKVISTNAVKAGKWHDAVFAIKGASGVEVTSLVVVPDCESPHALQADFATYIDQIELTSGATPRLSYEAYPLSFNETQATTRTDRHTSSISLTSPSDGQQTIAVNQLTTRRMFNDLTNRCFRAKAGETVSTSMAYSPGTWMHTYVYLDHGQDGSFNCDLTDDNQIAEGSDVVSFSYLDGKNSEGQGGLAARQSTKLPSFTIPADLTPGFYRMRFKVDWNNIDPAGNASSDNKITANGGVIVDTRLNVHTDEVTISRATDGNGGGLNGDILKADGSNFTTEQIPFGQPYTIVASPANGFKLSHVLLRHGYNLDGDSLLWETPQYLDEVIPAFLFQDNQFTIPSEYIDGDVRLIPYFSSDNGGQATDEDYPLNFDGDTLLISRTDRSLSKLLFSATKGGQSTLSIPTTKKHVYRNMTDREISVVPGDTVKTEVTYRGRAMHHYLYIDYNQDGRFDAVLSANGVPMVSSELVSYTCYNNLNSKGEAISTPGNVPVNTTPQFVIPSMLPTGVYRARFKTDWNDIDPGGHWSADGNNKINDNGGYVVDFLLNVHNPKHKLTIHTTHGSINGQGVAGLPPEVTPFQPLSLTPKPIDTDYTAANGIIIRHGHNFDGPQYIRGNRQWSVYRREGLQSFAMPKDSVNGDVEITANFEPSITSDYQLIFAEEFDAPNGSQPNSEIWERADRQSPTWKRFLSINEEEHKATGWIENGEFVARCIPNPFKETDNVAMISGAIRTLGKFAFTYGKIEGRLRTIPHSGNFPAFWMMPNENKFGGWPLSGEIDIWEQIDDSNTTHHTIHSKWGNTLGNSNNPVKTGNLGGVTNGNYHTFGLEWNPTSLIWFVDGRQVFTYNKSTNQSNLDNGQWPFDEPFYIILNQSVGDGSWARAADTSFTYETRFDWVRVYQRQSLTGIEPTLAPTKLSIDTTAHNIRLQATAKTHVVVSDLMGRIVFADNVMGVHNVSVSPGCYIVNGKKVVVR